MKVYCAFARPALLYAAKTWVPAERLLAGCHHRTLRYMSKVRWKDRITNEEVRRRSGMKKLERRLRKIRLRWFGNVKHRDENNILRVRWSWRWKVECQ